MNTKKKVVLITVPIIILACFIGIYCIVVNNKFSDVINYQKEYISNSQVFNEVATTFFKKYDSNKIEVGTQISDAIEADRSSILDDPQVNDAFKKLTEIDKYYSVQLIDKDAVFITTGAYFQSISGIAITRNGYNLESSYACTGYDNGITYTKFNNNVFEFSAGL